MVIIVNYFIYYIKSGAAALRNAAAPECVILSVNEGSYKQITPIMYNLTEQERYNIL